MHEIGKTREAEPASPLAALHVCADLGAGGGVYKRDWISHLALGVICFLCW